MPVGVSSAGVDSHKTAVHAPQDLRHGLCGRGATCEACATETLHPQKRISSQGTVHRKGNNSITCEQCGLAPVANDAAGFDVEADVPDGQPRLVAERGDETQESLDIRKVRGDPDGSANGAGALVPALLHHAHEREQIDFVSHGEPGTHIVFRQAFRNFSHARIAEASGAQRDVVLACHAVDVALIDHTTVGMKEVERDRRAAALRPARTVDRRRRRTVGVSQRTQHVEQPRAERADASVDRLDADPPR